MKPYTLDEDNYVLKITGLGYLSHPYGLREENREKARKVQFKLLNRFPGLALINGIDNATALGEKLRDQDGFFQWDETAILQKDFQIIDYCNVLILCQGWEDRFGCRAEWAYAMAKEIPILRAEDRYEDEIGENPELFELFGNTKELEGAKS